MGRFWRGKRLALNFQTAKSDETIIGDTTFVWGERTYVMGVINVTPDSFSGDGIGDNVNAAVEQALQFEEWGADIIDVGGESTRPPSVYSGATPIMSAPHSSN